MQNVRPVDAVWNRACAEVVRPTSSTAQGDRALAHMLLTHGLAMNGGVLHALDCLNAEERVDASRAYRHLGLEGAAAILEEPARRGAGSDLSPDDAEQLEIEADLRYAAAVAGDGALVQAFKAKYQRDPTAFAPVY